MILKEKYKVETMRFDKVKFSKTSSLYVTPLSVIGIECILIVQVQSKILFLSVLMKN